MKHPYPIGTKIIPLHYIFGREFVGKEVTISKYIECGNNNYEAGPNYYRVSELPYLNFRIDVENEFWKLARIKKRLG